MTAQRYRSYTAETAVGKYLIVKPGTADMNVVPATGPTDLLIGTADGTDTVIGDMVDMGNGDLHHVLLGGTVTRGQPLTSDANGKAVAAAPAAGVNNRIIGYAELSGVANDVITYHRSLATIQG